MQPAQRMRALRRSLRRGAVAGLLALAFMGGAASAGPDEKGGKDAEVVATVNGEPVTRSEWTEIWKADQWYAPTLKTKPPYTDRMAGRPYEDFFFTEEVVKIRGMSQKYAAILPQMKEAIEAAHRKLKEGGDFAQVAREHSQEEASAVKGGDLGNMQFHELVFPFNRVAFKLAEGEISEPVLTIFGYHLIKVDKVFPATEGKGKTIDVRHILVRFPATNARAESEALAHDAKVQVLDKKLCKKLVSYCTDAL
jgi:hypothetical protein